MSRPSALSKKRKFDLLITNNKREAAIREIITYFNTELEQEIGIITAEDILDFFLDNVGLDIYNKAVEDSKITVREGLENLEINLESLLNR